MMNKAKLILLACPAFLASTLIAHNPAQATKVVTQTTKTAASAPSKPIFEVVFERPTTEQALDNATASDDCGCSGETPMLNFTDQESNAAIQRFGCDCAGCLNAVRQLQGKPPLL